MSIELQFLGAAGCVTGSQFLVTAGNRRVLIDCGMFQGSPEEIARNRLPPQLRQTTSRVSDMRAIVAWAPHSGHSERSSKRCRQ